MAAASRIVSLSKDVKCQQRWCTLHRNHCCNSFCYRWASWLSRYSSHDRFIHPCRSMCAAVRDSCAPALLCHGHRWPASLACDRFPADEDMCLAPLTRDYKHLHKGSSKVAEGRVAIPCVPGNRGDTGDSVPRRSVGLSVQSRLALFCTCSCRWVPALAVQAAADLQRCKAAVQRLCCGTEEALITLHSVLHTAAHRVWIALRSLYRLINGPYHRCIYVYNKLVFRSV